MPLVLTVLALLRAQKLPGAGKIQPLDNAPGGGSILAIIDPEGFPINLMRGQEPITNLKYPKNLLINTTAETPRKRTFQRFTPGPAEVHKLGHYGLCITS